MRRVLLLLVASACLVLLLTAAVAPDKRAKRADDCTWGASSTMVEMVDGKVVQSEPVTTGCIPR
jgi:hypothetical protein